MTAVTLATPEPIGKSTRGKDPINQGGNFVRKRLSIVAATVAVLSLLGGLAVVQLAKADDQHARPSCTAPPMQPTDPAHGSRDGFDHFHVSNPEVFASLAELEGFLNVCRTNDNPIIEGASGSARVVRVSGVNRIQARAQLQQWRDIDIASGFQGGWVTVASSDSVNTGDNRTLTVTTPFLTVNQETDPLTQGWTRVNVRALIRSSDNSLNFYERQTYPIWVDDGDVTPLP